ncbi:MAG: thiamine pyrophosphokinae, catalytic region [Frankiales bacterium]|nr:thiamine pyrophosphokinae, catalytic region [Frankiales bacterium]
MPRRSKPTGQPGIVGVARLDRRTKNLAQRIKPGEIAVIDHVDLDRVAAESLVAKRPAAVVNAGASISGRYPNVGPQILLDAGVPLIDHLGSALFGALRDGDVLRIDGDTLYVGTREVGAGIMQTEETVAAATAEARASLSLQIEAFAANTIDYLRRERDLLIDGVGVPDITTKIDGRQVMIVVRGYHYLDDIRALQPYLRDYRPVLIAVDGAADALLELGFRPDLIIGDMDSVGDAALRCGAEIVVHAYPDGRAPGLERVHALGLDAVLFPASATSEDIAMLLADEKGASLIVAVGTHATLVEFLDKGREGMASTFLTRLRVGGKLVDAKGVSRLYRGRIRVGSLLALVAATVLTLVVAVSVSPVGRLYVTVVHDRWNTFLFWIRGLFS